MRVQTNTLGQAFSLSLDFLNSISTIPGTKYIVSFFSLINCPKADCYLAKDIISVRIKQGSNGVFTEVYRIAGRTQDNRWIQDSFTLIANADRVYVNLR